MRHILYALCLVFLSSSLIAQDTTIIQTLTFADITKRRDWFQFPDASNKYRKILMEYTLKCDAATTQDGYPCGEWDYLSYNFVYDHTGVLDSNLSNHPHYLFGGQNLDSLWYSTTQPVNTYESYEYFTVVDAVNSQTPYAVGTITGASDQPLGGYARSRSQYLWTVAELQPTGIAAGDIHRFEIQVTDHQTDLGRLTISMKNTTTAELTGFENGATVVYDQATPFPNGANVYNLDLLTPFTWDGTSNILVEFAYEMAPAANVNQVSYYTTADTSGIYSTGVDNVVTFENSNYMEIPLGGTDFGDEVTVSFWSFGNPAIQPANSYSFEAVNSSNQRVLNVHLPWSDGSVYWDAGEGSGYDRINKAATQAEYEGNWVHWAFTKNAATGSMKIYKNGSLWHSGTDKERSIGVIDRFFVGSGFAGNSSHNGKMDEFRVWNVELDQATIAAWMHRTADNTHPNYSDLLAYYNFNQDNYQITDQSAYGNDPYLVGVPTISSKDGSSYRMDATLTSNRPYISFVQGDYTTHLDSALVTDIVGVDPITITEFAVQGNGIQPVNTAFAYVGYSYIHHADGTVDSVLISPDQVTYNDTLWYHEEAYEVIDRYEVGRYITPYGIQLSLGPDGFKWMYDVTDYAHLFVDSVDFSAGNQQELIDVKFLMIEGQPMADVVELTRPWGQSGSHSYGNLDNDVSLAPVDVDIDPAAEHFKMITRFTGHGHNTSDPNGNYPHCCEWKDNTHYLKADGSTVEKWHVWQTHECAQNPVFPQGGTWPGAREGWCPGDVVKDNNFIITEHVSGATLNLDYAITPVPANNPGMAGGNYVVAMHLMQYGAANHSLDAEVYDVINPNSWEYYSRINPYCDDAKVVIRNAGETTLTSLTITYKVDGGQPYTYDWTGNLEFMESEEVVLPINSHLFWEGHGNGKFIATVSAPNGGQDEYADNDTYISNFVMPNVYEGDFIIRYKTNNLPNENYWEILDVNGNVVAERSNSAANTTYMDTMDLAPGCYTFNLYDSGDDGLAYWAYPAQGSGFCRFKANGGSYIQTFEAEFGGQITHGFSVGVLASINEPWTDRLIELYPNPNNGEFTLEMAGMYGQFTVSVFNNVGQSVYERIIETNGFHEQKLDLRNVETGLYTVRISGKNTNEAKRVIIQ